MSLYLRQNSPTNSTLADLGSLFDPPCFKLEELPRVEDLKPSSCTTWGIDDTLSSEGSVKKRQCLAKKPRTKTMFGEKALRLGNNGRRLVRSAIAKALLEKPELRERCRQVSTVKSATVKQLLQMCEIVGEREVAEDAIRQMDPTIELDGEKLWEHVHEEGDTLRISTEAASPTSQEDIGSFFISSHLRHPLPDLKLLGAACNDKPKESSISDSCHDGRLGSVAVEPSETTWASGGQDFASSSCETTGYKTASNDTTTYTPSELNIFDNPLVYNASHQREHCQDVTAVSSSSLQSPTYLEESLAPGQASMSNHLLSSSPSSWRSLSGLFPIRD